MTANPEKQGDKVLSQADIDTLLGGAGSPPARRSEPLPNVAPVDIPNPLPLLNVKTIKIQPPVPGVGANHTRDNQTLASEPAGGVPKPAPVQVMVMQDKLATLESTVEKNRHSAENANDQLRLDLQAISQQIQVLSNQLIELKQTLENTGGYNLARAFKCTGCGSTGAVAIPVRCNICGKTNWWGWWPKEQG
jgi:hypothetical protein